MRQLKISKSITNRETLSLEKYLQEIGREQMVTAEEEAELARLIKAGDQKALNKLTKANLRFVVSVAKQYQNQGLTLADLINEGNLGLIKAAQRFDETKGFKFISYAVWWIRQSIIQALAEQGRMVRIPVNKVGLQNKINRASNALEQQFEREPSIQELAHYLDMKPEEVEQNWNHNSRHLSLDAPVIEGEDIFLYDTIINEESNVVDGYLAHNESLKLEVKRVISCLTQRQKEVISLYFGLEGGTPLSLEDIGTRYGLTRERVRQIKDKAIIKLQSNNKSALLKSFLGN
jgi:RNA polymerase primary sigma factor